MKTVDPLTLFIEVIFDPVNAVRDPVVELPCVRFVPVKSVDLVDAVLPVRVVELKADIAVDPSVEPVMYVLS